MRLEDIVIVLARPSEPGNTGAICRAMKNMGLFRLRLASPVYQAGPNPDVRGLPQGPELEKLLARALHASEIWEEARRFDSLEAALADCAIAVGTTRRRGKHRKSNTMRPWELAEFLKDKNGPAAIVFGNERTGLNDGELALCNLASHIPADREFPSVNLSHAVQIYAYELYRVLDLSETAVRHRNDTPDQWIPMTLAECTALARRIGGSLESLGFYRHPGREEQERFLRDLFSRAGLTLREGRYLGNIAAKAARLTGVTVPSVPPTFEKVWQMFQETDRQIKETDRQIKETAKQMKETDKKVGELTNRFGDMVEYTVVPNLLTKFKALDFTFEVAHKNTEIKDEKNKIFLEVDVFLENGDRVMIVEIKATPTTNNVDDHIKRMEKLRKYADLHKDSRKYLGAIAGVVIGESVKNYALKAGFFVVVPSGDTFNIIKPEGKYHVREW